MMHQILIDADACPVIRMAEATAKRYGVPVTLLCDESHALHSDYSTVRTVSKGADSVDLALINACRAGDLVITQDFGVAALALGKGAKAIHQSGKIFTDENIGGLLMMRHEARRERMGRGKTHLKGPKKRTTADDEAFLRAFEPLVRQLAEENAKEAADA